MGNKYKLYIVIDGRPLAIQMVKESATETEVQDFLKSMQKIESIWVGLENGDMVGVNSLTGSVYFEAVKVN